MRDRVDPFGWRSVPIYRSQDSPAWLDSTLTEPGPGFDDVPHLFVRASAENRVTLMHAHHGMFALEFLALRASLALPFIVSFYGFDASGFPRSSRANAQRLRVLFDVASVVLVMSEDMRDDLIGVGCPERKVILHRPAVDLARFRPRYRASDGLKILSISDFTPKKGTLTLIRAFAEVQAQSSGARLLLAGTPSRQALSYYKAVKQLAMELGIGSAVEFLGWVDYGRVNELYRDVDVFVLPSEQAPDGNKEGVPAVMLEAMASGIPVVATRHAGIPETLIDGETGILVSPGDSKRLSRAISRLLGRPAMRRRMGAEGRRLMEMRYGLSDQIHRLECIYDEVIGSAAAGGVR